MEMKDITGLLGKVAPWIAAAAAGPAGLAGMAIKTAAAALGSPDDSPEGLATALASAKPEQLAELRKAELDFKLKMQELGFTNMKDMAKIAADDRKDARHSNVSSGMNGYVFCLSIMLLIICLGSEVTVLFYGYPASIPDLVVGRVLGLMDAVAMMVLTYWYGTTDGSARKTDLLAQSSPAK